MSDASILALGIDKTLPQPLYLQLYEAIRAQIITGKLASGAKMPSSRALALELGVSRASINEGYSQLVAEGYLISKRGSGFFVNQLPEKYLQITLGVQHTRKYTTYQQTRHELASLSPGVPDMGLFPHNEWGNLMARIWRRQDPTLLDALDPFGDVKLRAALSDHLQKWRGVQASPNQILITAGSIDGLEIAMRTVCSAGETIYLENPGYDTGYEIAKAHHLPIDWFERTSTDIKLPQNVQKAGGLGVVTPSHQFPLSGALKLEDRLEHFAFN